MRKGRIAGEAIGREKEFTGWRHGKKIGGFTRGTVSPFADFEIFSHRGAQSFTEKKVNCRLW